MNQKELNQILSKVAYENHTTLQQVRKEILIAMEEAQRNTDPNIQAMWASIPEKGNTPTLEEFMEFLIHNLTGF